MGSLPIGIILMSITVFYAVDIKSWPLFLNFHSMIVVLFGTFSVMMLSTPSKVIKNLFIAILELFQKTQAAEDFWLEFDELSRTKDLSTPSRNKLINAAVILWESGVTPDLFIVMISQKRSELEINHSDAVQALRNLAKYPPALGMLGTVVGLVTLFSNLGASNKSGLGPALALAMTATFFGLILANAVIMPLADRMHVQHLNNKRMYTEIYQILLLINRGESLDLVNDNKPNSKEAA